MVVKSHRINQLLFLTILFSIAGRCLAAPQIDASNEVGGSSTARDLRPNNFWAQSFTVSTDGLLSQVDVQLGKFAGATGDVTFELLPLVDGLPTTDDRDRLFETTIDIDDVPVINSLSDPPPFVTVDVSSAGIHAQPGDTYAISMRRSGSFPTAAWRSTPNSYSDGTGFFRNLLNVPWAPAVDDLGFQTWVDPTPTSPYSLRVDPTYDVHFEPGTISSLVEGETGMIIGGSPGSETFPEQRPLMEFPIDDLPANAVIQSAHLEFNFYVSSGSPRIEVVGFPGDGLASFPDATTAGTILAITPPTSASSPDEVPIDANYISSLVGQASHLGIRMRSLDTPLYVGFTTLEAHSSLLPPQLVIDYTLAQEGDFNLDGVVNSDDITDPTHGWEARFGEDLDGFDLLTWQRQFTDVPSPLFAAVALPEPSQLIMLIGISIASLPTHRRWNRLISRRL